MNEKAPKKYCTINGWLTLDNTKCL